MKNEKLAMFGYEFEQREDGMLNATAFINQWNEKNICSKKISEYMRLGSTMEMISELERMGEKAVESVKKEYTKGRPSSDVYMNPVLFISMVMWLDARFSVRIMPLIHKAAFGCDVEGKYNELVEAFGIKSDTDKCTRLLKAINLVMFGTQEYSWNSMTNEKKEKMYEFLNFYVLGVEYEIVNFDSCMNKLKDMYNQKHVNNSKQY